MAALRRLKSSGVKIVLVSGRELPDFLNIFPEIDLFELLVLENGAILYDPKLQKTRLLAPAPPEPLVERLRSQNVPLSVGHSVVATFEPHEHAVLSAVRDLQLEWHVIFNKGAVMCLPAGVTKATGLAPALEQLGISADETVAAGDAENDHAMLQMAGLAVAPANALDAVKQSADLVTEGARGGGVQQLIDRWLNTGLSDVPRRNRV
ncbi:MAG: HAD family hydrolase [Tepidisphaeraceae bacterium]